MFRGSQQVDRFYIHNMGSIAMVAPVGKFSGIWDGWYNSICQWFVGGEDVCMVVVAGGGLLGAKLLGCHAHFLCQTCIFSRP